MTTVVLHVRVPADVAEKLNWLAATRGSTRPAVIRNVLHHISKDARPPNNLTFLSVPADKLARWKQAAAYTKSQTVEALIDRLVDGAYKRFLRDEAREKAEAEWKRELDEFVEAFNKERVAVAAAQSSKEPTRPPV